MCNENLATIVAKTNVFRSILILPINSVLSETAVIEDITDSEKASHGQNPMAR